jgi:hypothetical protein
LYLILLLQVIGMLPLRELALDSHAYRQQPSMPRPQFSHLDNEGVKGLVDSICSRMRSGEWVVGDLVIGICCQ